MFAHTYFQHKFYTKFCKYIPDALPGNSWISGKYQEFPQNYKTGIDLVLTIISTAKIEHLEGKGRKHKQMPII